MAAEWTRRRTLRRRKNERWPLVTPRPEITSSQNVVPPRAGLGGADALGEGELGLVGQGMRLLSWAATGGQNKKPGLAGKLRRCIPRWISPVVAGTSKPPLAGLADTVLLC